MSFTRRVFYILMAGAMFYASKDCLGDQLYWGIVCFYIGHFMISEVRRG